MSNNSSDFNYSGSNFSTNYSQIQPPTFLNQSSWVPEYEDKDWLIPGLSNNSSGSSTNIEAGVRYLWNIYFTNFVNVRESQWLDYTELNEGSVGSDGQPTQTNQSFWTTMFRKDLVAWYNSLESSQKSLFTSSADTSGSAGNYYQTDAKGLAESWATYLNSEDTKKRTFSCFLYVFDQLMNMLDNINTTVVQQSERMSSITSGESEAVTAMSAVLNKFKDPKNSSDQKQTTFNQQYQLWLQVYQGYQSFSSSKISQVNNELSQSNESLQDQQTMMSSLIQQMETILNNLFR